jgi:hypothetical protein
MARSALGRLGRLGRLGGLSRGLSGLGRRLSNLGSLGRRLSNLGSLGRRLSNLGSLGRRLSLGLLGSLLCGRLLLLGRGGVAGRCAVGLGQRGVEQIQLAGLGLLDLQGAFGAGQSLELLPVAGDLQQLQNGFGRLGADAEPVLGPLRIDLDEAGIFLRVIPADDLDRAGLRILPSRVSLILTAMVKRLLL